LVDSLGPIFGWWLGRQLLGYIYFEILWSNLMPSFHSLSFATSLIGLLALTSCNNAPTATNTSTPTTTTATPAADANSTEKKDVDYMTNLSLMKGHLLVAKELLAQGKPDQAEPHIGHPVEEIYSDIEPELQERNVAEFKTTLNGLHDLVQAKPQDPKLNSEMQSAMTAVDKAMQAVPAEQRESPQFALKIFNGLLDTAGSEYTAAIANGKITEAIEYQDSRGFVTYADTLYESIESKVSQKSPEAHQAIESDMAQLVKAWPSAIAPAAPVMPPEQVSKLIKTIEQNTQKVL